MKHQDWGQYMFSAAERMSAFGAHTFSTVIKNINGLYRTEMRKKTFSWLYDELIIHGTVNLKGQRIQIVRCHRWGNNRQTSFYADCWL
jgi:hypothetical protein